MRAPFQPLENLDTKRSYPLFARAEVDVSFVVPARKAQDFLAHTVDELIKFLGSEEKLLGWEIILVPNPSLRAVLETEADESIAVAKRLAEKYPAQVRVVTHFSPEGKGAALRTGFLEARGRYIFFTDADLPYDLNFFREALRSLRVGTHLVTANRRRLESEFDIPVNLLPLAYKRHRLGLLFNRGVRLLFPSIKTTDTQAGMKALSRDLAQSFVMQQLCPGFFFDVELFLVAKSLGYPTEEFPVLLYLRSEKSTVRLFREGIAAVYWLLYLFYQKTRGHYRGIAPVDNLGGSKV